MGRDDPSPDRRNTEAGPKPDRRSPVTRPTVRPDLSSASAVPQQLPQRCPSAARDSDRTRTEAGPNLPFMPPTLRAEPRAARVLPA